MTQTQSQTRTRVEEPEPSVKLSTRSSKTDVLLKSAGKIFDYIWQNVDMSSHVSISVQLTRKLFSDMQALKWKLEDAKIKNERAAILTIQNIQRSATDMYNFFFEIRNWLILNAFVAKLMYSLYNKGNMESESRRIEDSAIKDSAIEDSAIEVGRRRSVRRRRGSFGEDARNSPLRLMGRGGCTKKRRLGRK